MKFEGFIELYTFLQNFSKLMQECDSRVFSFVLCVRGEGVVLACELDTHLRKCIRTHVLLNVEVGGKDGLGYQFSGTFPLFCLNQCSLIGLELHQVG